MSTVVQGLILVVVVFGAVELFARWYEARVERREQLLQESWALYRASRAIHDETAAALQAMLDEARRSRSEGGA